MAAWLQFLGIVALVGFLHPSHLRQNRDGSSELQITCPSANTQGFEPGTHTLKPKVHVLEQEGAGRTPVQTQRVTLELSECRCTESAPFLSDAAKPRKLWQ